ncbi:MAG TPA: HD domain-containing protein [Candidatus Andersenbacteria bacterium]|nr:HD domain-containing protein [Candidatus Andersenbacteria bacterium]
MKTRKTISLPGQRDLDISSILPLVNRQEFQRLRGLKQLGPSFVFIGSNHTRFDHSLYAYSFTKERVDRWQEDGSITQVQGRTLELYALLHDIGHSAYSHAIERLCAQDHNEYGLSLLHHLNMEIRVCGGNMQLLVDLMSRRNPLHACVSDRPLGTDKIAYLVLDSRNTTEQLGIRTGALLNHVSFSGTGLAINPSIAPQTLALQRAYVDMYIDVYCRKACLIAQAFLEQIVDRAIRHAIVRPDQLQQMDDSQLDAILTSPQDAIIQAWFQNFKTRNMPKSAIEIRPLGVDPLLRKNGKPVHVYGVPPEQFDALPQLEKPSITRMWEGKIAEALNIPDHMVLIVPPVPSKRFLPDDVAIVDGPTLRGTLHEKRPKHYEALIESVTAATALRICVPAQHREKVSQQKTAQRIISLLLSES